MPDNEARRQAEDQIKRLVRDPQVVPSLIHQIRTAKTPNVRQLSAVLLRKKITGHWPKLPDELRHLVKHYLIESVITDYSPSVRRASANAVSIIAKYAVPRGEWPDLLPFLFQWSQSAQEDDREVALILFNSLTETIGDSFRPYFADLHLILLKAVGAFIESTHDESVVVKFREFVPGILNISRQCLASGEENIAIIAFEIFDELIESPAPLLGESIKAIVQFSLEVCSTSDLESNTRHQAMQIISSLVRYKSNSLKKHNLIIPILRIMCPLLTEVTTNNDEDDDLSPDRAAAEVIDTMSLKLSKHVFPPVFEFASESSQNVYPKVREASVMVLGVISEGCSELMKEKLEPILHITLGALRDPEQVVRGASSYALGQFAEYLQPEIISHYERVLPRILRSLQDATDDVKEKSYYALAAFCANMGEEVLRFIDPLMEKLLATLQNSPRLVQETCMSAIGSVASATDKAFVPYVERVLESMRTFMLLTKNEDLRARARATELVGIVAMVAGRERMEPILPPFIEAAISGYGLEYNELHEYTHGFFSNVAEILEDGMVRYLPYVVPLAFSSCNLDDGSAVHIHDSYEDEDVGIAGVSSDDEAQDEPRVRNFSIRTGVLDEKAAATQALGLFALHTKNAYAPYLEESLKIMVKHSIYFHEDVRLQAVTGLKHILTAANAFLQGRNNRPSTMRKILDSVMTIYIKTMNEDEDKEVVAQACMSVAGIIKDFGYVAVDPYMPRLVESTLVLLCQKSACQQVESDSEINPGPNELLMDAVTDLLPASAKALGSHFALIFATLFDPLMDFVRESNSPQGRTMVVACLAEVAQHMGAPISGYVDKVMPLVLEELASSSATNRRNAAFCVGELCKNGGEFGLKYFGDVLRGLYPLLGESEPDHAVRDNAAGAVAKMITSHQDSVQLDQVLPALFHVLPLKEDHEESIPVYSCICSLVLSSNSQILKLVPDLVRVFAQVAISPLETQQVKLQIGGAFSHLVSLYGHQMKPMLRSMPPTYARALAAIVAQSLQSSSATATCPSTT
ncbi:importin-4-like isoform X3 [Cynara cardunculus var. scolymus]|uniref:importin-4-like isoform X3 n=1 Tax=Cynara cardunculus var. scolymus TaxID=59895 RepID=UPI000D62C33A|nr:importin-4-like isoform X3 [Cynara cardunculus var. scolymus]